MDTIVRSEAQVCEPWNKGKVIGAKPPLRPKHVWAVRTRLAKPGDPFASKSRSKRARQSTTICPDVVERPVHTSFPGMGRQAI